MKSLTQKPNISILNMFTNIKDQFAINTYRVDISTSCLQEPWEFLLCHLLVALSLALLVYVAYQPYVA
ncbi:34653_t:CDS:1, partial [Racocetra persica]